MSHYSKIQTKIVERDALCAALKDLGYTNIEVHEQAQGLYGYKGDLRPEKAEVVIRRKYVGHASNDIGFRRTQDGTWEAIVSEYDQVYLGQDWVDRVCQKYAEHAVLAKLEAQGFEVCEREIDPVSKKVHLRLKRGS